MNSEEILLDKLSLKSIYMDNENTPIIYLIGLTKYNKESLVFLSIATKKNPMVLFTADSDLEFSLPDINTLEYNPIVTAPHHGSDINKEVYCIINSWVKKHQKINATIDPLWVRSDSVSKYRPCQNYIKQKFKYCTICNQPNSKKQPIKFLIKNSEWTICRKTTKECICI